MAERFLVAADEGVNVIAGQVTEADEKLEYFDIPLGWPGDPAGAPPRPTTASRDQRELRVWMLRIASMPARIAQRKGP